MISAGYMYKQVSSRPKWIKNKSVKDIFSVSSCCSSDFTDYINYWKHNGLWLFNNPSDMNEIIKEESIDSSALTLFYYEVYEDEYDEYEKTWSAFDIEKSFKTNVLKLEKINLQGFDVVSFHQGTSPECSLLSCNSFADQIKVNAHCLFETFSEAKNAIENDEFEGAEPGPYRIFSVHEVEM